MPVNQSIYDVAAEAQIAAALGKIYDAYKILLQQEANAHGLSPLQIQALLYLQDRRASRLSDMAKDMQLSKPTTSEAVKTLQNKLLIEKETDETDRRTQTISLSEAGTVLAASLKGYTNPLKPALQAIPITEKEQLYLHLLSVIAAMQNTTLLPNVKMCYTCRYYRGDKHQQHFCHLLNKIISWNELKLHCDEHERLL